MGWGVYVKEGGLEEEEEEEGQEKMKIYGPVGMAHDQTQWGI